MNREREREEHKYDPDVRLSRFVFCCNFTNVCYLALMADFVSRVLLFCVLSAVVWSCVLARRTDVMELKDLDFDYLTSEQETMLIKFYAPW